MLTADLLLLGNDKAAIRARQVDASYILTAENERHGEMRVNLHMDREQAQALVDALLVVLHPGLKEYAA